MDDLWPNAQRDTPSFSMGLFADRVNSILEAPLPKCLRLKGEVGDDKKPNVRRFVSPRSSAASTTGAVAGRCGGGGSGGWSVWKGAREGSTSRPIHETLLEKGRLAAERRESMRLKAIEEELSHLRPAPTITYTEVKKTPRRGQRIEDRLLRWAKETEERRECEAKRCEEEMLKEMSIAAPFWPTISRKGRRATSKARKMIAESQRKWYHEREQHKEAARTARLLQDLSEIQSTPVINLRSEKLAARRRKKEGLSGLSTVDALIERDRIAQLKRWERHEMEKRIEQIPQITLYAATRQRSGDAAERLYAESYEKKEQRLRRQQKHAAEDNKKVSFTPRISPRAAAAPRFCSVEDELLRKHTQSMLLKEEARKKKEEEELRRHRPVINRVSEVIAARLPETSFERLCSRQSQRAPHCKDPAMVDSFIQESCSGARRRGCGVSLLPESLAESLQLYEESRQKKMRKLREDKERLQREECTFAPVTNVRGCRHGGMESVVARSQQWLSRKEKKLRELRRKKEAEKVKECTFRPERESSLKVGSLNAESIYGDDGTPWGVQEYLERQEEARRVKRESEARLLRRHSSSSRMPRATTTTKPQEFMLGRRNSVPIRSLRRPLHVPLMSPEKYREASASPKHAQRQEEDDLSVYDRIYNRVYNTVFSSGVGGNGV